MQIVESFMEIGKKNLKKLQEIASEEYFQLCKGKIEVDKKNIIIIDLDGTIINNLPRQETLYKEKMKNNLKLNEFPIGAKEKYHLFYNIFESIGFNINSNKAMKTRFIKYFLKNKYLNHDIIIPGAKNYIKQLIDSGFFIIFLTGRHHKNRFSTMKKGTIKSLIKNEINISHPNINLFMKPNKNIGDLEFKSGFIKELLMNTNYNLISFIDNESKIVNTINKISERSINVRFNGAQSKATNFYGYTLIKW